MDIEIDRNSWTGDPAGRAGGNSLSPEWHGLRARLSAARAARHSLAAASAARDGADHGSFDCASARVLADFDHCLTAVNPVFWANGKPTWNKDAAVAGTTGPGDRG